MALDVETEHDIEGIPLYTSWVYTKRWSVPGGAAGQRSEDEMWCTYAITRPQASFTDVVDASMLSTKKLSMKIDA